MSDHADQLRKAFETHEELAPDPAQVYARVQDLARGYQWRRRGAQAAGGAVLGAGLIAGVLNFPALLPGTPQNTVNAVAPAQQAGAAPALASATSPAATPSASGPVSEELLQERWDAYFGAGYGYDDAVELAKIWKSNAEIGDVKAEAGRRLLAGETLPVEPHPNQDGGESADPQESARVDAYFGAGYDWNDAVKLADLWNLDDPYQAKVEGGKKLLAGETLPIRP